MSKRIKYKIENDVIYNADSRYLSQFINKDSIDLILFSPPYWKLRDYNYENQIGFKQTYDEYIVDMTKVISECLIVLKKGRFLVINIGTVVSNEGMKFIAGDFVINFEKAGFIFRKDIIWHKPRGTTKWQRGATQFSQNPYPLMYNTNINHEYILIFQKGDLEEKPSNKTDKSFNKKFIRQMAYSVWDIIPVNSPVNDEKHVAPFPEELPKRIIQLFSFDNELILDPFAGCGTTAKVAKQLGRKSISVEMSLEYCNLINKKLQDTKHKINNDDIYKKVTDIDIARENLISAKAEYEKRLKEYNKLYKSNLKNPNLFDNNE